MIDRCRQDRVKEWGTIADDDPLTRAYANLINAKARLHTDPAVASIYARRAAAVVSYAEADVISVATSLLRTAGDSRSVREVFRNHALASFRNGAASTALWASDNSRWAEWQELCFESDPSLELIVELLALSDPLFRSKNSMAPRGSVGGSSDRIRVGYLIDAMTGNTVRNIFMPLFKLADQSKFELFLYMTYSPEYIEADRPGGGAAQTECINELQKHATRVVVAPASLSKFQASRFVAGQAQADNLDIIATFDPSEYTYLHYALCLGLAPYRVILALRTPTTFMDSSVRVHGFVRRALEESGLVVTIPTKIMEHSNKSLRNIRQVLGLVQCTQLTVSIGQTANKFRCDDYWQIVRYVLERNNNCHHLILGDVSADVANSSILGETLSRVHFLGQCDDVLQLLEQSDLCIDTVRTGAGGALCECYRSGLVAVGFDDTSDNEFRITENSPGIEHIHPDNRVPRWDTEKFGDRVIKLLQDDELRARYSVWARGRYSDHCQENVVAAYESLYSELANGQWDARIGLGRFSAKKLSNTCNLQTREFGVPLAGERWKRLLAMHISEGQDSLTQSMYYFCSDNCSTGIFLKAVFSRVTIVNMSHHLAELALDCADSVNNSWTQPCKDLHVISAAEMIRVVRARVAVRSAFVLIDCTWLQCQTLWGLRLFMCQISDLLLPGGKVFLRAIGGAGLVSDDSLECVNLCEKHYRACFAMLPYELVAVDDDGAGQIGVVLQVPSLANDSVGDGQGRYSVIRELWRYSIVYVPDLADIRLTEIFLAEFISEMMSGARFNLTIIGDSPSRAECCDASSRSHLSHLQLSEMCNNLWHQLIPTMPNPTDNWVCDVRDRHDNFAEAQLTLTSADVLFYSGSKDDTYIRAATSLQVTSVPLSTPGDVVAFSREVCSRLASLTSF